MIYNDLFFLYWLTNDLALIFHRKNMEYIVNNPGFQHIAETAFKNLNFETLKKCKKVNKSCNEILKNPFFWLEKLVEKGLSVSEKKKLDRSN